MNWKWSKPNQEPLRKTKREMKQEVDNELKSSDIFDIPQDVIDESSINSDMYSKYTRNDKIDTYKHEYHSGRDWVAQTNTNPFLKTNNYLNDLKNEDMYLRPRNSNINEKYLNASE